jgi:hypothetical protein
MKSLMRIHRTYLYEEFEENTLTCLMYSLHKNMSYVFSSNFISTCPMYSLQTLHIRIGHVYMKSLKRIHRTCLYEEFEKNALDMFI